MISKKIILGAELLTSTLHCTIGCIPALCCLFKLCQEITRSEIFYRLVILSPTCLYMLQQDRRVSYSDFTSQERKQLVRFPPSSKYYFKVILCSKSKYENKRMLKTSAANLLH